MKTEIEQFRPCPPALKFRKQFNTFKEAWDACPRGDWMLWIADELEVDERKLFLAKGLCAQTVVHLMIDERSVNAVNAAIAYGKGEISRDELRKAAADAADAAAAAFDAAGFASASAGFASASAAFASAAASSASAAFAATDAKEINKKQTADICREILTDEVMEKINAL